MTNKQNHTTLYTYISSKLHNAQRYVHGLYRKIFPLNNEEILRQQRLV
jgi:hypothetical protein